MKIAIIGTGYVGLVSGACMAEKGNKVICVDNNQVKVELLQKGEISIYEPSLSDLVKTNFANDNLNFTTNLKEAVQASDIIFFCLPTPQGGNGQADLRIVLQVAGEIGEYFNDYKIIVNKSTVPVGTAQMVKDRIGKKTKYDFDVVSNPEFLREGTAVYDFLQPDRIVIGAESKQAEQKMVELYSSFAKNKKQILTTDIASSELIKYAANAFLAIKISFINQISQLAEYYQADIESISKGIGLDPRIGEKFLRAGIGYGGSCFPKDVAALEFQGKEAGIDLSLIQKTRQANQSQKQHFIQKLFKNLDKIEADTKKNNLIISLFGLAFKAETDDVREAPAIDIIKSLNDAGFQVKAYDPKAKQTFQKFNPDLEVDYCNSVADCLNGSDLAVVVTDWKEFKTHDFLNQIQRQKITVLLDGRNMFSLEEIASNSDYTFDYISIGRKEVIKN